jgi:hypothetical protein
MLIFKTEDQAQAWAKVHNDLVDDLIKVFCKHQIRIMKSCPQKDEVRALQMLSGELSAMCKHTEASVAKRLNQIEQEWM